MGVRVASTCQAEIKAVAGEYDLSHYTFILAERDVGSARSGPSQAVIERNLCRCTLN
jgi:hypothetical protein